MKNKTFKPSGCKECIALYKKAVDGDAEARKIWKRRIQDLRARRNQSKKIDPRLVNLVWASETERLNFGSIFDPSLSSSFVYSGNHELMQPSCTADELAAVAQNSVIQPTDQMATVSPLAESQAPMSVIGNVPEVEFAVPKTGRPTRRPSSIPVIGTQEPVLWDKAVSLPDRFTDLDSEIFGNFRARDSGGSGLEGRYSEQSKCFRRVAAEFDSLRAERVDESI